MKFERAAFEAEVSRQVTAIRADLGLPPADASKLRLEVIKIASEFEPVIEKIEEETASAQTLVPHKQPDGTVVVEQLPIRKVVQDTGVALAVGFLVTAFFGPLAGAGTAGAIAGARKLFECLLTKKTKSFTPRDSALLAAFIAIQFDAKLVDRKVGVYPTVAELRENANVTLSKGTSPTFADDREVAIQLDELQLAGIVKRRDDGRWNLEETVWVPPNG